MSSASRPRVQSIRATRWSMAIVEEHWEYAAGVVTDLGGLVIAVTDGDGNEGFGYANANSFGPETLDSVVGAIDLLARTPVWRDLTLLEARARWDRIVNGNPQAKTGLELALVDLIGRREGIPAHEVLGYGRANTSTGITRILALDTPEAMIARASELIQHGATGLKIKAQGDLALDGRRVREIRDSVGDDVALVVDANGTYSPKGAIRLGRVLDECGVAVFEQPVGRHDLQGLSEVRAATRCMIEADESAATVSDVLLLARHRAVDCISIKLPKMGGLIASLRIARLCRDLGLEFRVGSHFGSRIYESACAQLLSCVVSEMPHELGEPEHLEPDAFPRSFVVNGRLELPPEPGLGVPRPAVDDDSWQFRW